MKILLATHHFLPRYTGGAELYAYRTVRWLRDQGHTVSVVCVESITDERPLPSLPSPNRGGEGGEVSGRLRVEREDYDGLPVYRLTFNLARTPDPFRWSYWNPDIGRWFEGFLREQAPDVLHLNSGYLLSGSVIAAARAAAVPFVLVLHDFWFLCPRLHLQRPDASLSVLPNPPAECAWCLMTERRRYRLPDVASRGLAGRMAKVWLERSRSPRVTTIEERRRTLIQALEHVPAFVVLSRFMRDVYVRQGLPPERFHVIRMGLQDAGVHGNSGHLTPQSPAPQYRVSNPVGVSVQYRDLSRFPEQPRLLRIGYLGHLQPHKGVHLLVQAFRNLPLDGRTAGTGARLTVYGDLAGGSSYVQQLRRLADGDPRIVFAGAYDNRHVGEVLAGVDVVVVPSTCYENSPTVILEAQANGTPVIAANLGGMAELVHHDVDGLLFRRGDAGDLARQLQRLLDEPDLLPRLRTNAPPVPTLEAHMQALMEVYTATKDGRRTTNDRDHPSSVLDPAAVARVDN